ncbi:MAG: HRDC domain-containing protein, partial [Gammaproteobacteria bacterium]
LKQMVERRPGTEAELSQISGVGQHKLDKYGREFLEVINLYPLAHEGEAKGGIGPMDQYPAERPDPL